MPAAAAGVTYTVYQQSRLVGGATWVTAAAPIATGVAGLAVVPVAGLTPNTQYRFYLVAVNAAGSSANGQTSNTVTARQLANAPATTTATANAVGTRTITVNWTLGTANGAAVTGIQVQRATNAGFTAGLNTTNLAATALTTTTPRMVAGTTYYFRVAEVTAGGASVWGPVVSATAR
jgi:hypothetical protein